MIRAHSALLAMGLLAVACGDDAATTGPRMDDSGTDAVTSDAAGGAGGALPGGFGGEGGVGGALPGGNGGTGGTGGVVDPDAGGGTIAPDAGDATVVPTDAVVNPDIPVRVDGSGGSIDGSLPDALPADAALPDAVVPTPADAGAACIVGDPDAPCGPWSTCVDGVCAPDLQPNTYRMNVATVLAPATAADTLTTFLQFALNGNQINLLIEAGGYAPDGAYLFNLGNGRKLGVGRNDPYVFNHTLPIQNVYGSWLMDAGTLYFDQGELGRFNIFAPGRSVPVGGELFTCWTEIAASVRVTIEPRTRLDEVDTDNDGQPDTEVEVAFIHATADGYMTVEEANAVAFNAGGVSVSLSDFLNNEPVVDANQDGLNDEYLFNFEIDADPILLADPNPARDPETVPEQPAECNNL